MYTYTSIYVCFVFIYFCKKYIYIYIHKHIYNSCICICDSRGATGSFLMGQSSQALFRAAEPTADSEKLECGPGRLL